ncbi:MAG: 30S ribosomal protein S6 [bacterium]|nr:30S ribosomal protein S6 [bacterium]
MRNYELTLLLRTDVVESELQGLLGEISSMLQDEGALITSQDSKGKRALLAPVKKHAEARLAVIKFTIDPQKIEVMDKKLREKESILRFTLLSYAPGKAKERTILKTVVAAIVKEPTELEKVELEDIDKRLAEIFREEV